MDISRKNIILVISFFSVFFIPLFFDNRLLNVNIIHRFLFSIVTLFLCILLCFYRIKYSSSNRLKIIFFTAVLFLFLILISSEVNDRLQLALEDFALYLNVFVFAYLVFVFFQLYDFDKLMFYISLAITLACVVISILGILEFFHINLLNFLPSSRPGSTLGIRNFASEYSVIALPFLLTFAYEKKNRFLKIYSSTSLLVILTFVFFCRTRTSFVVLLAYIIIITFFYGKRKFFYEKNLVKNYVLILFILIVSYIIGMYSAPNIDQKRTDLNSTVSSIVDESFSENVARINYWKTSLKIFRDEPVTGVGSGSWFGIYPKYNGYKYNDNNIFKTSEINPHNEYFEILSENGIFGFIFFTVILLIILWNLFFETLKEISILPVLLSFSGFLIISAFSFPKDNVSIMILLSTVFGISISIINKKSGNSEIKLNLKFLRLASYIFLPVLISAIIIFSYIRYESEIAYISGIKDKSENNYKSMLEKFDKINFFFYPVDANRIPVEYYKGVGEFELKKYDEALNSFDNALNLAPYAPAILSNKASTYYMLKDNENAIKLFARMKRYYPLYIEPQINLLAIYTNTGKDSLAMNLMNEISNKTIQPESIKNYFVLEKIKNYYNEKNLH